jgi:hypothetical protein
VKGPPTPETSAAYECTPGIIICPHWTKGSAATPLAKIKIPKEIPTKRELSLHLFTANEITSHIFIYYLL